MPEIITNIEGGNVHNVARLSKRHFSLEMKPDVPSVYRYPDHQFYWFYFKIEGVMDKEIKIDITNCIWMKSHWRHYRPVYSYAEDPDALKGVEWDWIENTKLSGKTFSFIHRFENDSAWVALRYPYNYTRSKRYIDHIRKNDFVEIEELGKTVMGNPLYMALITDKNVPIEKKKGVLVYAREHGVEQDGSWVAEGMIDFLLTSAPYANTLRRNIIFMVLPIISPDAVIGGRVVEPFTGKSSGIELMNERVDSVVAGLLLSRMKQFIKEGKTLDICISLHNPHGTEPNLYPHFRPYKDMAKLKKSKKLHKAVIKNAVGYTTWKEFTKKSCAYSVGRFARDFGSLSILYEVNHQAKKNFLSLKKLKGLGEVILLGIGNYFGLGRKDNLS